MAALRKSAVMGSRKTPLIRAAGASGVMPSGMQGAGEDRRSAIAISLLGRLQVRDADGAEIAISGYKARALLGRSEEHTSELQSLMRISYAVFCLKKKTKHTKI